MKIDLKKLQELVDQKYLSCRERKGKLIWNYTAKCQYDKHWTEETLMCRGLITDLDGLVLARPFKKFFNVGEHKGELPCGMPNVYEKMDGSLGILYWEDGEPRIATRGSFESDQAKKANEILAKMDEKKIRNWMWNMWQEGKTVLFEIIYPENRIVVNYDDREELVLLGVVDIETGKCTHINQAPFTTCNFYGTAEVKDFEGVNKDNEEGYVLRWDYCGTMLKVKFTEYVRLHRVVTGFTVRRVWGILRSGESMAPYLDRVPDEFYEWIKKAIDDLNAKYLDIESVAIDAAVDAGNYEARKEQAQFLLKERASVASVAFNILDEKDYDHIIWKMLQPAHETPFKIEI